MACPSFILARQPVQSSNQGNPIPDFFPRPHWKRDRRDWEGDRSCLYVCQHERLASHPKQLALHPHHQSLFLTLSFSLGCSAHSGLSPVQACIPVTEVVEELYGTGIKL